MLNEVKSKYALFTIFWNDVIGRLTLMMSWVKSYMRGMYYVEFYVKLCYHDILYRYVYVYVL